MAQVKARAEAEVRRPGAGTPRSFHFSKYPEQDMEAIRLKNIIFVHLDIVSEYTDSLYTIVAFVKSGMLALNRSS